jgi:hypothetical protein
LYGPQTVFSPDRSACTSLADMEQEWSNPGLSVHPCPCNKADNHKLQRCLDRESISADLMFGNIEGFNWDHIDDFRDEWCWPGDESETLARDMIHSDQWMLGFMGNAFTDRSEKILTKCQPYPGDSEQEAYHSPSRFVVRLQGGDIFAIHDNTQCFNSYVHMSRVRLSYFSVGKWYAEQCAHQSRDPYQWETAHQWLMKDLKRDHCIGEALEKRATQLLEIGIPYNEETTLGQLGCRFEVNPSIVLTDTFRILDHERCISTNVARSQLEDPDFNLIEWYGTKLLRWDLQDFHEVLSCSGYPHQPEQQEGLHNNNITSVVDLAGVQVDHNKYHHLQRNAASVKGDTQILPKPIVIQVQVNGHPAQALVDSGSLGDFMSSTLADQLRVKRKTLDAPLGLQLAVQGSQSKINTTTEARLQYQGINSTRHFNIINLNSYDIILGTPWLYQHKVCIGLNPSQIIVGCGHLEPIHKGQDTKLMVYALSTDEQWVETARAVLHQHAELLC